MNSDWLHSFLVFSESMNFTRAAERLHISQPALHIKIKKLSEHLHITLYVKTGRTLVLTQEGVKIQAFAREFQERTQSVMDELHHRGSQSVHLAAGSGAYLYLIGSAIANFKALHANPLRLLTTGQSDTLTAVANGRAHLGVTALQAPFGDLKTTLLTQVGQVAVVPKEHALASKTRLTLVDLSNENLILPSAGQLHRTMVEQALAVAQVPWTLAAEADGWQLMLAFTALKLGITVVNACCHVPPTLRAIPIDGLPIIVYYIVERDRRWGCPSVDRLKDILIQHRHHWKES